MMRPAPWTLLAAAALLHAAAALAYELNTHDTISRSAVRESRLGKDPEALTALGLGSVNDPIGDTRESVLTLVGRGARLEDDGARALNHFFDPTRAAQPGNGALRFGFVTLPGARSSPDWALEDRGQIGAQGNSFSDGRSWMLQALTSGSKTDRDASFAMLFQTLGMVIHHIQDMAQPQHVRNDLHCIHPLCKPFLHNPSAYENYTDEVQGSPAFPLTGYASVYAGPNVAILNAARKFWYTGDGKGIAEFTNRNFVSDHTNFRYQSGVVLADRSYGFPAPLASDESLVPIQLAYEAALKPLPQEIRDFCGGGAECSIEFFATSVVDRLTGATFTNPRAASLSVFDHDLQLRRIAIPTSDGEVVYDTSRVFSLNSFNFDEAHRILIKRAVGYSAGLIDYFFRGRIDLVFEPPSPAGSGGYFIKNLGTEGMKGSFALYYDNAQEARKPVKDRAGADVVWRTTDLLPPDADGLLAAGARMQVTIEFDPPADARIAGEYMLVFAGDMGEEKVDEPNGVVGAVAAKLLRGSPYRGALYVAGLDAQNRFVTFKVDPEGLRVLNGPDANGQFRFTPATFQSPTQRDMDPLLPIVQSHSQQILGGSVLERLERVRQVEFESSTFGGMSHRTVALSLRHRSADFNAYTLDSATGRLALTGSTLRWRAGSVDSPVGEFEFSPIVQNDGINGSLFFLRRFRPAPGAPLQLAGGTVPLPTFPGSAFSGESINFVSYNGFKGPNLVVSPDGLTISGFKTETQENNQVFWNAFDLKLTLGVVPAVSLVQTEHLRTSTGTPDPTNGSESSVIDLGTPPDTHLVEHARQVGNSTFVGDDRRFWVDYINGALVTWRDHSEGEIIREFIHDRTQDIVHNPLFGCPQTRTREINQSLRHADKSITTTTVALDQKVTSVVRRVPKLQFGSPVNYTLSYRLLEVYLLPCVGETQLVSRQETGEPVHDADALDVSPSFTGFTLHRTLNGRVDGSILFNWARSFIGRNPPPETGYFIDGISLGRGPGLGASFIAEGSPLGEVFVARADKSVIVYRPLPSSRLPQTLEIPPHIVKLVAALWF